MSLKAMDEILIRLYLDKEFRHRLRSDPEAALPGYDLTEEEIERLAMLRNPRSMGFSVQSGFTDEEFARLFNLN